MAELPSKGSAEAGVGAYNALQGSIHDRGEPDWWRNRRLAQEYEELLEEQGKQNMIRSSEGGRESIPSMKLEPGMDYNMRTFEPFTFESGGIFTERNKMKRKRPAGSI